MKTKKSDKLNNHKCPSCGDVEEQYESEVHICPDCNVEMYKMYGGRANGGGHDWRNVDQ